MGGLGEIDTKDDGVADDAALQMGSSPRGRSPGLGVEDAEPQHEISLARFCIA
jgi:hypothetical protein